MIKIVYTILVLPQNIQERITFMKMQKKRIVQCGLSLICAFGIALSGMSVHAEEVDSLEDKTSNLQSQLEGINQDLVTLSNKIAETDTDYSDRPLDEQKMKKVTVDTMGTEYPEPEKA